MSAKRDVSASVAARLLNQARRAEEELAEEFPGDQMMQELHLVRRVHQLETEGMDPADRIQYYRRKAERVSGGSVVADGR